MKKIVLILLLLAAVCAGIFFSIYSQRQTLVLNKIQKNLQLIAGTPVEIQGAELQNPQGLSRTVALKLGKVTLKNPEGFQQPFLAEVSNAEVELDFISLLLGRWSFQKIEVPITRVNLEIDSKAKLNLSALPALQAETPETGGSSFLAEKLEFKLADVYFYDYRTVQNPQPEEYNFVGQSEIFVSVLRPEVLIQAPALKLLYQLNKGSLGLARDKIQENVTRNSGKRQ